MAHLHLYGFCSRSAQCRTGKSMLDFAKHGNPGAALFTRGVTKRRCLRRCCCPEMRLARPRLEPCLRKGFSCFTVHDQLHDPLNLMVFQPQSRRSLPRRATPHCPSPPIDAFHACGGAARGVFPAVGPAQVWAGKGLSFRLECKGK